MEPHNSQGPEDQETTLRPETSTSNYYILHRQAEINMHGAQRVQRMDVSRLKRWKG